MNQLIQWWLDQEAHSILLYLLLSLLFLLVIRLSITISKSETNRYSLPPSPSKLPLIGNLHQLHGRLPHHALHSLAQKYGPLMSLQLGRKLTVVVSSADIARDVMKTYDHVFASRPQHQFSNRLLYGKDIAFAPYGEYWRQVRKVCVLQLLSAKKVQSFRFVREEEVALMLEKIKELPMSSSEVNLSEMFVSLANNVICRVALGRKYYEGEGGKKFKHILKEFVYLLGVFNVRDLIPSLAWVNHLNGLNARVESNFKELDSFLDQVIEEHIEKKRCRADGASANEQEDFVDVMLQVEEDCTIGIPFARDNIKAIILDMFAAGTDTSSMTLEWAMSELLKHPKIMRGVQKEVRNISNGRLFLKEDELEDMPYFKAVIKETLRLHPPVPLLVPRESMEDVEIQGYDIPAKTTIMINAFTIGRDPMKWDKPENFQPNRFLSGDNAAIDFKGQSFELIPFGAGRRGCPGIHFATYVFELALVNLLNTFDWVLPNGMDGKELDMHEESGLTVCRKTNLVAIPKPQYE